MWNEYDIRMSDFPDWMAMGGGKNVLISEEIGDRNNKNFQRIYQNIEKEITHSWDSQFFYTRLKTGGLGIVPCRNLIHNIGAGGTHTESVDRLLAEEMPAVIRHPKFVVLNREYEEYHYHKKINRKKENLVVCLLYKLYYWMKAFLLGVLHPPK